MSIRHHPADELLLAHAAGQLPTAPALVMASHLELCAQCRARVREFEALGGVFLDDEEPAALREGALERALAAVAASPAPRRAARAVVNGAPPLPPGVTWPRALAGCRVSRWRWFAPGMHYSRVNVPADPAANVFLLRIGAGKYLPPHTHTGREMTQILCGSFHDGRAHFGPGDFDATDHEIHHQPVVQGGQACICLASVEGRVLFDSFIARKLGALIGM
jgi:putative transcriptional regulator